MYYSIQRHLTRPVSQSVMADFTVWWQCKESGNSFKAGSVWHLVRDISVEGPPSSSVILQAESPATGCAADPKELFLRKPRGVCLLGDRNCTQILKWGQTLAMFAKDNHAAKGHESCIKIKIWDDGFLWIFLRDLMLLSV